MMEAEEEVDEEEGAFQERSSPPPLERKDARTERERAEPRKPGHL